MITGLLYAKYGFPMLPWNVDAALVASLFFYIGILIREYYQKLKPAFCGKYAWLSFFIALSINLAAYRLNLYLCGEPFEMNVSSYGIAPLTLLAAISGSIAVIVAAHWFSPSGICYIGRNSLLYYAWHQQIFIPLVRGLFKLLDIQQTGIGIDILKTALIVLALTLLNMCLIKSKLKFMLGR